MTSKPTQDNAEPGIVPGYGEADSEAASMDKAAQNDEVHGSRQGPQAKQAAADAAAKVVPAAAGPVGQGTSETDVKGRIDETARRKAAAANGAQDR